MTKGPVDVYIVLQSFPKSGVEALAGALLLFFGQTMKSHSTFLCLGEKMEIRILLGDYLTNVWDVTCDGCRIPSRGSRNTLGRFILHKLEISLCTDEHLAHAISIGADFVFAALVSKCCAKYHNY